jgi:hypothetical protein
MYMPRGRWLHVGGAGETCGTEFYDGAFVLLQTHRRPNSAIVKGRLDTWGGKGCVSFFPVDIIQRMWMEP